MAQVSDNLIDAPAFDPERFGVNEHLAKKMKVRSK